MDTLGSGIQFFTDSGRFWDAIMKAFKVHRLNFVFVVEIFSRTLFVPMLSRDLDAWGFQNQVCALKILQNTSIGRYCF